MDPHVSAQIIGSFLSFLDDYEHDIEKGAIAPLAQLADISMISRKCTSILWLFAQKGGS